MERFKLEDLNPRFVKRNASVLAREAAALVRIARGTPKPEPDTRPPLEQEKAHQTINSTVVIHVHSVRSRLLDVDNIYIKDIIDGLRYLGVLVNDSPAQVAGIFHTQEHGKEEKTIVRIYEYKEQE